MLQNIGPMATLFIVAFVGMILTSMVGTLVRKGEGYFKTTILIVGVLPLITIFPMEEVFFMGSGLKLLGLTFLGGCFLAFLAEIEGNPNVRHTLHSMLVCIFMDTTMVLMWVRTLVTIFGGNANIFNICASIAVTAFFTMVAIPSTMRGYSYMKQKGMHFDLVFVSLVVYAVIGAAMYFSPF